MDETNLKGPIEFSRNTKSWQCWHFCTTSSENKFEVVTSGRKFNANLHLSLCFFIKTEVTDNIIHLIFKVKTIQKCQNCQLCVLWENLIALRRQA